jgi:hypothetical protein
MEGLAPQQQVMVLTGAVFDLGEQVATMDKAIKKEMKGMEQKFDARITHASMDWRSRWMRLRVRSTR